MFSFLFLATNATGEVTICGDDCRSSHMLVSRLSLLGDGFEGSFSGFPLVGAGASPVAATVEMERLVCSSLRASGLG